MARIRKINVSQVEGNTNGVLSAGTIAAYEVNGEYVLRVHDGVTAGGVPFPNAPSITHNNDINLTIDNGDSSTYTWNFGQTGDLTLPVGGDILDSTGASVLGGAVNEITNTDGEAQPSTYSVSVGTDGVVTMTTSRGVLEFGALPEPGAQSHFHIMRAAAESMDLYFGDDFNYVLQRGPAYNGSPAYGVEIGANDNNSGDQQVWRFGTDGDLTLPAGGDILDSTGTSVLGGGASTGDFTFSNADITVTDNASLTVTGDSIFTATISSSGGMFWLESNSFLGTYTSDSLGYSDFGQFDGQKVIFFDNVMSDNLSTELSAMAIGDTILVDELSNPYTVTLTSTFSSLMGRFIASVTTAETNRTVTNQVVITRTVSETNEFQFKGSGELVAPKIVAATSLIIPSYTINECGFGRNTVAGTNGAIISVSDSDQDVANPGGFAGYYTPNMLAYWVGNINQNPSPGQEAGAWVYLHQDGSSYYLVGN